VNPLWVVVGRIGTLLGVTISLKNLREIQLRERNEIQPHRIYNTREAALLLGVERIEVVAKLTKGQIKGRMVNGNYRIPGSNLLRYLESEEIA
jgi:excisionase family DNA binding protein